MLENFAFYVLAWFLRMQFESQTITLQNGQHEIFISLKDTPQKVWTSLNEDFLAPICLGNIDYVNTEIRDRGFILRANINSAIRSINWVARTR